MAHMVRQGGGPRGARWALAMHPYPHYGVYQFRIAISFNSRFLIPKNLRQSAIRSAIYDDGLAGHIGGASGTQERDHRAQFVGLSHPAYRCAVGD